MARLDVYSDVICPWCYIGAAHLRAALRTLAAQALRFDVSWRPFELNPSMPEGGVARDEYRRAKFGSLERSRELDAQVGAAAAAAALEIRFDRMRRTPNTLDAHRLIAWSDPLGRQGQLVDRLFRAYFVEGRDVGARETLAALAGEAGLDPEAAAAYLATDSGTDDIRAEQDAVRRAGLSGVPTFVLERHVLFSGAVPPDALAEALTKAHAILVPNAA